jgi:hypothetical protein
LLRDFDLLVTGLMYKRASFGSAAKPGADYCAGLCSWHGEVSVRAAIRDEPAMADAGLGEDACRPVILPVQLAREKICERKNLREKKSL